MPSLFIRGLSEEAAFRFRMGALLRGWTQAKYLDALVELHESMRSFLDGKDDIGEIMFDLGLQSITKEG